MQVTATEFKLHFGKDLNMLSTEDIRITRNGKIAAKVINPTPSFVDAVSGILAGRISPDVDRHSGCLIIKMYLVELM